MDENAMEPNLIGSKQPCDLDDAPGNLATDAGGQYPSIWQAIGLLALFVLLQLVGAVLLTLVGADLVATVCGVNVLACLIVLRWGFRKTHRSQREVFPLTSFRLVTLLPLSLAVVGLSIILSEADNVTRWFLPMPGFLEKIFSELVGGGLWSLIALVIVAPLTEEPLCRGLILGGFLRRYTARKAVLVSALLFAALHLNPYQFISAFASGVLMGWVFLRTRSLLPCIFVHALNNASGWIARDGLGIDIPGYTSALERTVVFQPLWFDGLGVLLLAIGLLLLAAAFGKDGAEKRGHH